MQQLAFIFVDIAARNNHRHHIAMGATQVVIFISALWTGEIIV
jgi:hypothetical protein